MISSVIRYVLQFLIMILLLNIIFAKYEYADLYDLSNKRYAGRYFKYAWFTRNVHDEEYNQPQQQQQHYRMNSLKNIFYRKYRDFT